MENNALDIYEDIETLETAPSKDEAKNNENNKSKRSIFRSVKGRSWFVMLARSTWSDIINYETMNRYLFDVFGLNLAYACWNEEKADGGLEHMHLYIELYNPTTQLRIMDTFPKANVARRRGNPTETRRYVEKPEGHIFRGKEKSHTVVKPIKEIGDWNLYKDIIARGTAQIEKKSINERIEDLITACDTELEIIKMDANLYNTHKKVIDSLLEEKIMQKFKDEHCTITYADNGEEVIRVNLKVCYLFGGGGVGKTSGVINKYGYNNVFKTCFIKRGDEYGLLFDSYRGEGVILIDEVSPYALPSIQYLNNLLDVNSNSPLNARYKDKLKTAHTIIFVSNYHFNTLFKEFQNSENKDAYEGFYRRFTGGIWKMERIYGNGVITNVLDKSKLSAYNLEHINEFSPVTNRVKVIGLKEIEEQKEKIKKEKIDKEKKSIKNKREVTAITPDLNNDNDCPF